MSDNKKYDAIIIGAGMTGSWIAKELCEKGVKCLMIERGRNVKHKEDYPTANTLPWEFKHGGQMPEAITSKNPSIARCYAYREDNAHFFVKDEDHPYVQTKPFDWIRGYQVGGRSLMWARQTQRWSDFEFEGPARDGFAVDWPIRYKDLAPWYSYVEKFVGIAGNNDGLDILPDGDYLPAWNLNCVEDYFKEFVNKNYKNRHVIFGRCAHLTQPQAIHKEQGRGQCLSRTECERGCPFGAYFSANSSTIPWALKTGNLDMITDQVVESVIFDDEAGKATGVRIIDADTKATQEYSADLIFVNAGTLNTNLILLNSQSKTFPNGIGNHNGLMGKYVAFHNYRGKINAIYEGMLDKRTRGRKPTSGYIPRFRNVHKQETDFLRGYACGFGARRNLESGKDEGLLGEDLYNHYLKEKPTLGPWRVNSHMMGATIPKESNYVALDPTKRDEWNMPQLQISLDYDDNDEKMLKDFFEQMSEMYEKAGFTNIKTRDTQQAAGLDIHEMGGVRMGKDPKTSLLNGWNQMHSCKNVFVTDGACMTSTATQNPSLTFMAMSARTADYAYRLLDREEL